MRIALVLLFLTATQFAQADTLLKTKEGCAIVLNDGEDFDGASWSGKCKNGKIDGVGRLQMKSRGSSDYDTEEWAEYKDGRWAFPEVSLNAIGAAINKPTRSLLNLEECKSNPKCRIVLQAALEGGLKPSDPSISLEMPAVASSEAGNAVSHKKNTKAPASHLSIVNICHQGAACGRQFLHYENGQDPLIITPGYFSRTNGSIVTLSYVIKECNVGWTATVGSFNQNPERQANAMVCGAISAERALTAVFEECNKNASFNCKTASIVDMQWAFWDGSYPADPNPEYEMKSKGSPSSVGGVGGGGCRVYDQDLISCEKYKSIVRSVGVGR
ncbi:MULTISPECIES: hypothetical protein [unclassified Pseudomonas]|jgi:hypothetical protein|uniref:hypothetical protein n=1 Tax=unclassified Pseudomonas TaxID=196821 RepID=UPI0011AFC5C4|nr:MULTISPECIES: hypothetical protein [unclassified Pseudomonas]